MLDHAGAKPGMTNVTWRRADAQSLPFTDATFDAVVCQFGVMFFPDRVAGYQEARRVLVSGGRFLFTYGQEQVQALRDAAYTTFGEVAVLMNNAGTAPGGGPWEHIDRWRRALEVNLWGVINGVQTSTPSMLAQRTPCEIINTGSKQGITCPPGDTAYNVSKAGVKVLTEALAHSLRNEQHALISAHLLIPGSTFTGMTRGSRSEKPPGAWTPDQVVDMLVAGMHAGDFYILCPDNDVTREIDERRILWAAQDITQNRPALSRWIRTTRQRSISSGTLRTKQGSARGSATSAIQLPDAGLPTVTGASCQFSGNNFSRLRTFGMS
jgi:NAD(P)-dependent dehydrogenase (short-subunit alcohol dehydrogenase family)